MHEETLPARRKREELENTEPRRKLQEIQEPTGGHGHPYPSVEDEHAALRGGSYDWLATRASMRLGDSRDN